MCIRDRLADVRLDKVFFFVDELGCPFRHQTPGKHGFFGARWVRAFPHEQPVLLRLIPQALPICNDFGVPVLVSRFQIIGPFLRILVDGEEKLDLLFLILEVIVLIGDNGHDLLFIQKSGQLWAVRFLCICLLYTSHRPCGSGRSVFPALPLRISGCAPSA